MGLYCDIDDLHNESDVEQKFIYHFLSMDPPMGLGFSSGEILTKADLRKITIGKGNSKKIYYPDYVVSIRGVPVFVLEAKKPKENLETAYSEARLYATEINSQFRHNLNVCGLIMVSNGNETWAGYSDTNEPSIKITFDEFNVENVEFNKLLNLCSKKVLKEYADQPYKDKKGKAFFKTPVSNLGGRQVQNEELEENAFGRTLVFENSKVFDPETEEDRYVIVDNAYIPSAKREQHAEPIYKEIRKFEFPSKKNSIPLATENPKELADGISTRIEGKIEAYSLMLIIGNVGSGKTTFIRWFKRKYLDQNYSELAAKCDWIFIDMNLAPNSINEIYRWVKATLLDTLKNLHNEINFTEIETLKHIFRRDIIEFEQGIGQLLKHDPNLYSKELFILLKEKISDSETMLMSVLEYLKGDYGIVPIIVLDNCDKRDRDTQLLMFEVAQWLRSTFKSVVILPMRDSTYDMYKDEKPLDTIVKDLVFRIDPPDLLKVLQARLEYISRATSSKKKEYSLGNGMIVSIGGNELVDYYKSIMMAIRQTSMIRNIFYRLSDKNTRKGIEMFEDFCKSGHISADEIFQIRVSGGICNIPAYKFLNAILRKNRRYYNGEESNFVNLFGSDYNDDFPDPFVRVDILLFLNEYKRVNPDNNLNGMLKYNSLVHEMELIGHSKRVINREINYLIKKGLILIETQLNSISENDLLQITIPGMLHLTMLDNVPYLAACAEDVNYKTTSVVTDISNRLTATHYLSKIAILLNSRDLITYLDSYRDEYLARPQIYVADGKYGTIFDLKKCRNAIEKWIREDTDISKYLELFSLYPKGKSVCVKIVRKQKDSLVCLIDGKNGYRGFLSVYDRKYNLSEKAYRNLNPDDEITCEILYYDYSHDSFQLKYVCKSTCWETSRLNK